MKILYTSILISLSSVILQIMIVGDAFAQDAGKQGAVSTSNMPTMGERVKRLENFQRENKENMVIPEAPDQSSLTEETAQDYQQTLRDYYDYRQKGYEHRLRVFEWQFISSIIIFAVVLILVFAGIYFAAIQFHHGLRESSTSKDEQATSEFVFSFKEIKVRSPVLGVIVLTLSLAFFYLYLVYVYPIENVF
jgi:hypothetical protein